MATPVRRCELIDLPGGKRGRGRPKKSLDEVIREDLKVVPGLGWEVVAK